MSGVTVSLSPASGGIKVHIHTALLSSLASLSGARAQPFEPSVEGMLPSGSLLSFETSALDKVAPRILGAGAAVKLGGQIAPLQAPVFNTMQVGYTTVQQLALAPGLQFDYTVTRGVVAIATSVDGIKAVLERRRTLADDAAYRSALPDRPERVSSLLFLDFSQLLSLGEQTGLTGSATYRAFQGDLDKIRAIGLSSTGGKADSTAELFLQFS
jgi:hypothetical protein